ncbi:MAG: hypothetical protein AAGF11_47165 [Myxococcota bacterium]
MLVVLGWVAAWAGNAVDLEWTAPAECPDRQDVLERIDGYLVGAPERSEPVSVRGEVTREAQAWTLHLQTRVGDEQQERMLTDADCDGLAETAAVLVAIAVSPALEVDEPSERNEPAEPNEPAERAEQAEQAVVPPPTAELRSTPQPAPALDTTSLSVPTAAPAPVRARQRPRGSLRVLGGFSAGWLPPGGDVGLAAAVSWQLARIEVSGLYGARRQLRFSDVPNAGADATGWAVGAQGCGIVPVRPWLSTPLCLGVEAGQVRARPVGLIEGRPGTPTTAAAVVAPGLRFEVHPRVALWICAQLLVPWVRAELDVIGEDEPLFRSAGIGTRLHGGLEVVLLNANKNIDGGRR